MKTVQQIQSQLIGQYRAACASRGFNVNAGPGSEFFNLSLALASVLVDMRNEYDSQLADMDPRTASSEALDRLGARYGLTRKSATAARGNATIEVITSLTSVFIPDSLRLTSPTGEVFKPQTSGVFNVVSTSVSFPIEAVTPGALSIDNNSKFSLSQSILGLNSYATVISLSQGSNIEGDNEFRLAIMGAEESDPNAWGWGRYMRLLREVPGVWNTYFYPCYAGPGTCQVILTVPPNINTYRYSSASALTEAKAKLLQAQTDMFATNVNFAVPVTYSSAFITGDTSFFLDSVPYPDVKKRTSTQSDINYANLTKVGADLKITGNISPELANPTGAKVAVWKNGHVQTLTIATAVLDAGTTYIVTFAEDASFDPGGGLVVFPAPSDPAKLEAAIVNTWGSLGPGEIFPEELIRDRLRRAPSFASSPCNIDGSFANKFISAMDLSDGALHYVDSSGVCPVSDEGALPNIIVCEQMGVYKT